MKITIQTGDALVPNDVVLDQQDPLPATRRLGDAMCTGGVRLTGRDIRGAAVIVEIGFAEFYALMEPPSTTLRRGATPIRPSGGDMFGDGSDNR